jgi:excisionase family DNA binding protein
MPTSSKHQIRLEEMMNIREVCKMLGVSPATVINLVAAGDLPAYRVLGTQVDKGAVSYDSRGLSSSQPICVST